MMNKVTGLASVTIPSVIFAPLFHWSTQITASVTRLGGIAVGVIGRFQLVKKITFVLSLVRLYAVNVHGAMMHVCLTCYRGSSLTSHTKCGMV